MKVIQKKIDDTKVQLSVVASAKEVNAAFDETAKIFAQRNNIAPEQGKTVAQIVEERLGIKDLDSIVLPQINEYLIPFALDKKNLVPAILPKAVSAKSPKRGEDYSFTLDITLKPEYELSSYDPVAITVQPFKIDEREIDAQLAQMADAYAEYVDDEPRPVQEGDSVSITMKCSDAANEPVPALTFEGRVYMMGQGYMPPSFDENLLGMNVGETKEFSFSGPGLDAEGNEISQTISCTATVDNIKKKVIPAINDAWVTKNMPWVGNVENLKTMLRTEIERARKEEYELYRRQIAAAELAKRFEGKIDDAVYESMFATLTDNLQAQLMQQGMRFEDFVAQNGGEQQFRMMLMMEARKNLVEGYALDALYRHEKLTISDEDLMAVCRSMSPDRPEELKAQMEKSGYGYALRESAARLKANNWLVEHADITVA